LSPSRTDSESNACVLIAVCASLVISSVIQKDSDKLNALDTATTVAVTQATYKVVKVKDAKDQQQHRPKQVITAHR
jgi:hypothetical protein